jgi:hypothetical protein
MKATELRIGNWVRWNYEESSEGNVYPVEYGYELDDIKNNPNIVNPIPLTEEWLLKFGFNKVSDIWEFWKNSGWDLRQHKLENKWWLFYNGQDLDCVRIDYVHQLQNLYFALTGEELTLIK